MNAVLSSADRKRSRFILSQDQTLHNCSAIMESWVKLPHSEKKINFLFSRFVALSNSSPYEALYSFETNIKDVSFEDKSSKD